MNPKRMVLPMEPRERCGWNGCQRKVTGLYRITDSFGRTYEKTACAECAKFWFEYRPSCKLVRDLTE